MAQTVAKTCTMMITTETLMQMSSFTLCVQLFSVSYPHLGVIEGGGREDTTTTLPSINVTRRCKMAQTVAKTCEMMITTETLVQILSFTLRGQQLPVSYPSLGIEERGG